MSENRSYRYTIAVLLIIITVFISSNVFGDEQARKGILGLSAAIQGSQTDIQLPYWIGDKILLVPSFSVISVSDGVTDLGAGFALRFTTRTGSAVPYVGFRAGGMFLSPDEGDSQTDWIFGPMAGGEYFLSEHFSVGVEAQLNVAFSDKRSWRFGNPDGTNINTATSVMATFYF